MKVSHIEHLGVAVKSLDEAIPYWENVLGLKCYAIEEVADQKVRTAFFMLGQTKIELLEPTSEDSTIAKYIEIRGVEVLYGKELKELADKPEEKAKFIAEKEQEYNDKFSNPYNAARYGYIDDVIEPRNTRFRVIRALQSLATKRLQNPAKKHSNIPL